jgi:hypothetical protein
LSWRLRGRGDRLEDQLGDPTGVGVQREVAGVGNRDEGYARATLESASLVVEEAYVVLVAEHDPGPDTRFA